MPRPPYTDCQCHHCTRKPSPFHRGRQVAPAVSSRHAPIRSLLVSPVAQMPRLAKIDSCPLKRSFSYLILTVALRDRPPAPTRRTPRRIAKRRIDKAARRDNGRPFRVAVPSKLPIPVCVGARPVQLLDERSSAIKLSKIPRRGARPAGRSRSATTIPRIGTVPFGANTKARRAEPGHAGPMQNYFLGPCS